MQVARSKSKSTRNQLMAKQDKATDTEKKELVELDTTIVKGYRELR